MDIFFQDPTEIPLPPDQVRIREFRVVPWPDGRRLKIYLEVDPFQKRPNANVVILDPQGEVVADVSVIESMTRQMEFNMHLRRPAPTETYQAQVVLYYETLPPLPPAGENPPPPPPASPPQIVDRREVFFELPGPNA